MGVPIEDDDVKLMRPLALVPGFIREHGVTITDMKWILNDTFLVIMTSNYKVVIFDVLL